MVQSLGFVDEEIWTMLDLKTKCRENNKISVTRFGEISPIWQNFKTIYVVLNGQILSKHSRHLATLNKMRRFVG